MAQILPIRGRHGVLASVGVLLAACATHRTPPPTNDIDENVYRDHVRELASDDYAGRRPGSPGEDKTVAYLVEQFRKLKLKAGNGASYLQQVPMVEIQAGADASMSIQGSRGTRVLGMGGDLVIWCPRARPQAALRGSDLVFVGYGIVAPEYGWNDYAGIDVHGKTVIVLSGDPGFAAKDPRVFKGDAVTRYGALAYKIDEAARNGAEAVLAIHDGQTSGYTWSQVQNTWMGPQLMLAAAGGQAGPKVAGWIHNAAARELFAAGGLDFAAVTAAAARPGFRPLAMNLRADTSFGNSIRQFNSANVIALLPGASRRNEYVVYTAHWDHLGSDATRPGHNIFNGAVDNASGVAGLLAVAQSFTRTTPAADRSIVFLATTGAERGSLGAGYYVENPVFPLKATAAVINLDTLHTGGPTRDVSVMGFGNTDLEDAAQAEALLQGRELKSDPTPLRGEYFRSDNFAFAKAGVPALYVKGGIDDTARGPAWGRARLDDYTAHRYHETSDQYSADWDVRGTIEDLTLYFSVGNRLARSRRFPHWYPNSEFRVIRGTEPRAAE